VTTFSGTWSEALKPVMEAIRRRDATKQLAKAARWAKLTTDEQKVVVDFIVGLAEDAGTFYRGAVFKLDDICKPDRSGFLIKSVDDAYQAWKARKLAANPLDPNVTPLDYVKVSRRGPGMIVRTLLGELGPGYTWAGARVVSKQKVRWRMLAGTVLAGGEAATDIVRQLNDPAAIEAAVRVAIGDVDEVADYSRQIKLLIDRLAGAGNNLTDVQARALLGDLDGRAAAGKAVPNFSELVGILVLGLKAAEDEVAEVGGAMDDLLAVEGVESFFFDLVTRSGHANGSLYELRLAAERLALLADEGAHAPSGLVRLQIPMADGQKGPDLGWIPPAFDQIVLQQAKSYADLRKLTQGMKSNDMVVQVGTDLQRLKKHTPPFHITLPDRTTLRVALTLEWRVDWRRLSASSFATAQELADAAAALRKKADEFNVTLADPAYRASLGLSPSDPVFRVNMILDGEVI
jgi:hypothetical protein